MEFAGASPRQHPPQAAFGRQGRTWGNGTKTFFDLWQRLMSAEGIVAGADEGFYALTKDATVSAEVVDENTVRLSIPAELKNTSRMAVTVIGSGGRCRIDRFESVK